TRRAGVGVGAERITALLDKRLAGEVVVDAHDDGERQQCRQQHQNRKPKGEGESAASSLTLLAFCHSPCASFRGDGRPCRYRKDIRWAFVGSPAGCQDAALAPAHVPSVHNHSSSLASGVTGTFGRAASPCALNGAAMPPDWRANSSTPTPTVP